MKYVIFYYTHDGGGYNASPDIFETDNKKDLLEFANKTLNDECISIIACYEVHEEIHLEAKNIITEYQIKKD